MKKKSEFTSVVWMLIAVTLSNYLVEFPITDWLTWGAFPYPLTFLITELTQYFHGSRVARRTVYFGFSLAMILGVSLLTPRIALASCAAFLVGQLLDIHLFSQLRDQTDWWLAPLVASVSASAIDSLLFFSLAFAWTELSWTFLALGDFGVKLIMDLLFLLPLRIVLRKHFAKNSGDALHVSPQTYPLL